MHLKSSSKAGGHEHLGGQRVYLVRHGETTGDSSVRFWGATDVPLSALGEDQIRALRPVLEGHEFAHVVQSPLSRAVRSAEILGETLGCSDPASDEGLREVFFGDLEGMTLTEIQETHPEWAADWKRGEITAFPGGESLQGFADRVGMAMDRALAETPEGDLLVVAHRGVVKNALCHLLGLDRALVRSWSLDLASVSVVAREGEGKFVLDRYNVTGAPA